MFYSAPCCHRHIYTMGNVNVMQSVFKRNTIYFMTFYKRGWASHPNRAELKHVVTSRRKKQCAASGREVLLTCRRAEDAANLHRFMSATRKSTACLSERPICGQTDRQAGRKAGRQTEGGWLQMLMSFRFMGGRERRLLGL